MACSLVHTLSLDQWERGGGREEGMDGGRKGWMEGGREGELDSVHFADFQCSISWHRLVPPRD